MSFKEEEKRINSHTYSMTYPLLNINVFLNHILCADTHNSFHVGHFVWSQHGLHHEFVFTLFIGVIVKGLEHNCGQKQWENVEPGDYRMTNFLHFSIATITRPVNEKTSVRFMIWVAVWPVLSSWTDYSSCNCHFFALMIIYLVIEEYNDSGSNRCGKFCLDI